MTGKKMKFIKILMLLIFFAVLLLGLFMLFFVRGLSYRYSIRPRQVYAGDPVTVKLTFLAAKGIQAGPVGFTGKKDTLNIEPRNSVIFDARFFKIISKEYLITEYVPGDYTVTGMSIKSSDDGGATWSETILPDQGFTVKSVLPDDFDAGPSKIRISGALKQGRSSPLEAEGVSQETVTEKRGPVRFKILENEKIRYPDEPGVVFIRLAVFAGTGAVVFLLFILGGKFKNIFLRRKMTPLERALTGLETLNGHYQGENSSAKEYCAGLYDIILVFLREDFELSKKEMMSEEIKKEILDIQGIGYEQKKYILDMFALCKSIKFSPERPVSVPAEFAPDKVMDFVKKIAAGTDNPGKS